MYYVRIGTESLLIPHAGHVTVSTQFTPCDLITVWFIEQYSETVNAKNPLWKCEAEGV